MSKSKEAGDALQEAKKLSADAHSPEYLTKILEAALLIYTGNTEEGGQLATRAAEAARAARDTLAQMSAMGQVCSYRFRTGSYAEAQKTAFDLLRLAEAAANPIEQEYAYQILTLPYLLIQPVDSIRFFEYTEKSLELSRKHQIRMDEAEVLTRISAFHKKRGREQVAIYYAEKAADLMERTGCTARYAALVSGIGYTYLFFEKPKSAVFYFEKAAAIIQEGSSDFEKVTVVDGLASALDQTGEFEKAVKLWEPMVALCQRNGFREKELFIRISVAECYQKLGEYKLAADHLFISHKLRDTVFNTKNANDLAEVKLQFEFDKKEAAILFEKKLADRQLENERLLGINRQNQIGLLTANARIASFSLGQKTDSLARLQLSQKLEKASSDARLAREQEARQAAVALRNRWVGILTGLLGLAAVALFAFRSRARVERERLRSRQLEAEMTALRAQMNPHFMFNSLNSIDAFLLKKEGAAASGYLQRSAALMRQILDFSSKKAIRLEEEAEFLENYLALESLRLDGRLRWSVNMDAAVDGFDAQLPPMILQPFVENAIWHGVSPKPEGGRVFVFFKKGENGGLLCSVEDDGVGRHEAARGRKTHESKGMAITAERLRLFDEQRGGAGRSEFRVADLFDDQGQPAGTRVEINIAA